MVDVMKGAKKIELQLISPVQKETILKVCKDLADVYKATKHTILKSTATRRDRFIHLFSSRPNGTSSSSPFEISYSRRYCRHNDTKHFDQRYGFQRVFTKDANTQKRHPFS